MQQKSDQVRALVRGLRVLKFINTRGETKAAEIAQALEIPRSSVYRLLQTLEEEGYIIYSSMDARVRVTSIAAGLGDNANRLLICQAAGAILNRFTEEHSWPIDLSVYEDAHMLIKETTHPRSTLSIDKGMTGFSMPMLRTSAGRAYLSSCSCSEREHILNLVRNLHMPEDLPFLQPNKLKEIKLQFKKYGYSIRSSSVFRPKTASIAVPVIYDGRVYGCIAIIWLNELLTVKEAIRRYSHPLLQTADQITQQLHLLATQKT
jgi:IclR family mhp operon transcriptional activator